MTSWWRWRKKISLLSLFSKRVPWEHETAESRPQELPPVGARLNKPHPRNAPGGFYVVDQECITCGVPHHVAPELIEWESDFEGRPGHCFFRKQPATALELIHAVKAVEGSCCGALRYRGNDPEIIQKLKEVSCGNFIDRLDG